MVKPSERVGAIMAVAYQCDICRRSLLREEYDSTYHLQCFHNGLAYAELEASVVGKIFRFIREFSGVTLEQLAQAPIFQENHLIFPIEKVAEQTIADIEDGKIKLRFPVFVTMCEALGFSVEGFLDMAKILEQEKNVRNLIS